MNEQLLSVAYQQACDHLLVIRKLGEWKQEYATFEEYVAERWSLSKTRAKLFCDFATFCRMCQAENVRMPSSPECVQPLLALPQKRWMDVWQIIIDSCRRRDINAKDCESLMEHHGIYARRKWSNKVLHGRRVRAAAKKIAGLGDGEKLVEEIGPEGLGRDWDDAVKVVIDADQAAMEARSDKQRKTEKAG